ncbi:MAG: hypothetical protein KDC38_00785 [Planctomycetes bacterium]|nr:hypothetical protein [Planctomycetota bacterium]
MRFSTMILLGLVAIATSACGTPYMREVEGPALASPLSGQSLVNFIRPSGYGGGVDFQVFDRYEFIGNLEGKERFQYVCAPGKHLFIGRKDQVTVVDADLLPDQVYDIVVNVYPGWWQANIKLEPMSDRHPKIAELPEWEERCDLMEYDGSGERFEGGMRRKLDRIVEDFVHGEKRDRVQVLGPNDHR